MMEKSIHKGKLFIFAIIVSSIIFLVLHNNDLYFQEYGNRIVLNVFRIAAFAPLLYFLYKKHNWARYTLAVISSILVIAGIIGFLLFLKDWMKPPDILYLGGMMVFMIFNAAVLLFSKSVISYIKSRQETT
jgi:Flp pilus assembly protein protease CpaA